MVKYEDCLKIKWEDIKVGDILVHEVMSYGLVEVVSITSSLLVGKGDKLDHKENGSGKWDGAGGKGGLFRTPIFFRCYAKKVKATNISRTFYKGKIESEIDGILTINLNKGNYEK